MGIRGQWRPPIGRIEQRVRGLDDAEYERLRDRCDALAADGDRSARIGLDMCLSGHEPVGVCVAALLDEMRVVGIEPVEVVR